MGRPDFYTNTERDAEIYARDEARDETDDWIPDLRDVIDWDWDAP